MMFNINILINQLIQYLSIFHNMDFNNMDFKISTFHSYYFGE